MYTVKPALPGSLGLDLNQPLTVTNANSFRKLGYEFVIRYLPRTSALTAGNLTSEEINIILTAGLSLGAVQHVELPGWQPSAALGSKYGQYAGQRSAEIGLPQGINIWLDLEEVATTSTAQEVIDYCKAWYTEIQAHGYVPGLYVGYQVGLTDQQLYDLPFQHYWRAYNCDQNIPTRGYQLIQHPQKTLNGISFDPNNTQADQLGGLPIFLSPD
jgi:Domain of unknown function (DUF1906)